MPPNGGGGGTTLLPMPSRLILLIFALLSLALIQKTEAMLDVSWWSSVAQLSSQLNLQQQLDDLKQQADQHQQKHQFQALHANPMCTELKGLSLGQKRICELFKDHMPAVGSGAKQAISECEWQFRNQRWNCSKPRELKDHIGPVHKRGTREAAFTYAILSAGVTHEIGRRCRLGMLTSCGCSETERPKQVKDEWTWGGCGDNIEYGYRFSRDFIDVREKEESIKRDAEGHGRSLMNRWNNEVGRRILKRHTKPKCKCHGVSGSCNLKTCWMQLPPIRQIGNILQSKYRSARSIQINSRGNMQFDEPSAQQKHVQIVQRRSNEQRRRERAKSDLVYLDPSPDYCRLDRNDGTVGTQGRICSIDSNAANSCDVLCCGRGYQRHIEEVTSKCNCKFQWCCQVVCETCRNRTEIFTCK